MIYAKEMFKFVNNIVPRVLFHGIYFNTKYLAISEKSSIFVMSKGKIYKPFEVGSTESPGRSSSQTGPGHKVKKHTKLKNIMETANINTGVNSLSNEKPPARLQKLTAF